MPFIWGPGSLHRCWICHVADASIPGVLLQGKKTPGATTARNDLVLGVEKAGKGGPRAWLMPGHVVDLTCKCSTVFKAWCFLTSTAKKNKYIYMWKQLYTAKIGAISKMPASPLPHLSQVTFFSNHLHIAVSQNCGIPPKWPYSFQQRTRGSQVLNHWGILLFSPQYWDNPMSNQWTAGALDARITADDALRAGQIPQGKD
jgi:hypothetical protein